MYGSAVHLLVPTDSRVCIDVFRDPLELLCDAINRRGTGERVVRRLALFLYEQRGRRLLSGRRVCMSLHV